MLNTREAETRSLPVQKKAWAAPAVEEMPRLTELTLQTGNAIPGEAGTFGGGSTVF